MDRYPGSNFLFSAAGNCDAVKVPLGLSTGRFGDRNGTWRPVYAVCVR